MVALVVAAVGALVLTLVAGVQRTFSSPGRYSASIGGEYDVGFEQAEGRPRSAEVAALPSVAAAEGATFAFGGLIPPDSETPVEAFLFIGSPQAFGARVVDGRLPDPASPGEFVATRSWREASGAQFGDTFTLVSISQSQSERFGFDVSEFDGPTLPATFVGVIGGATELQEETPLTLFGLSLLEEGDIGVASTVGAISLAPGATIEELRAQLDALPDGEDFGLEDAQWVSDEVRSAVRAQGQGLAVVALIVTVAAVAVVGQLTSRQVRISPTQRLSMRALGLTRRQLIADSAVAVALPIAAGSVLAGAISYGLSGIFPVGFSSRVEPAPGLLFDPLVHVLGPIVLGILLVVWVVVSLRVADRESATARRRGLTDLLAGRLPLAPVAVGFRHALVRHPRDRGTVRAPIIGLVVVQAVLVGALVFGSSVDRFLDDPARHGSNFDFATGAGGDEVSAELRELLQNDPDVSDVTLFGTIFANVGTTALDVTGMEPLRGSLEPDVLDGRLAQTADEIALGRVAARELDVDVGDELVVTGSGGPTSYTVSGLAIVPSVEGGDGLGEGALVTLEGMRRLEPDAQSSVAAVRLRAGADGALERLSAEMGVTVALPDRNGVVINVDRVRSTPFIVVAALAVLAALSMAQQLISSARRRRRDLAMVRALGGSRGWVSSVLHWQITMLALVVAIVSIPLGILLGRVVYRAYIDRLGARTDASMPWLWLGLVVVGALALGNLAAVVAARRARRAQPARTLADR